MTRLELCATIPFKARDSHAESVRKRPVIKEGSIETPPMPFETPQIKVRRTQLPPRPSTAIEATRIPRQDGAYAVKFSDGTWAHSEVARRDVPVTRDDVKLLAQKYDTNIAIVAGYKGVDLAQRLQAINDLLLDEIVNQLRVINLGQAELLERCRETYARIFTILDDDSASARRMIIELNDRTTKAESDKARAIEDANTRIAAAEAECKRRVDDANRRLENKMVEYDESMKRYLEQKAQLEDHVKALHQVFLDFQSDAVYLTLEDLKNKLSQAELKIEQKAEEVATLQQAISKWKRQHQEMEDSRKELEDVIAKLREQLKESQNKNAQLERQIEMLKIELEDGYSEAKSDEENDGSPLASTLKGPGLTPLAQSPSKKKRSKGRRGGAGSGDQAVLSAWINIHQKLGDVGSIISQFIETATNKPVMWNDKQSDKNEMLLLSGDMNKTQNVLQQKVDQVVQIAECLKQFEGKFNMKKESQGTEETGGRFVNYFSRGIAARSETDTKDKFFLYTEVRRIFQAKYLADKWNHRANRPLTRMPEFVIMYYYKDDNKIGTALHMAKRLWKSCKGAKSAEIKMFRKFLKEKYTLDELTFFLEMRHGLLGLPVVKDREDSMIKIPYTKCKALMDRILGAFSPVASLIGDEAEKLVDKSKNIDYAAFLQVFVNFYTKEREKRRTAVRLMVTSKKNAAGGDGPIVFEVFCAILQSLGFKGSIEQMLEFYRCAKGFSGGNITLNGVLEAMDDLNIHFYSIDIPMEDDMSFERTEVSRQMVLSHWAKFGQWFEGLRRSTANMDTWVRSQLILQVRKVDQAFQLGLPSSTLYAEFRSLLDLFQFFLGLLSRGSPVPMKCEQSEKQLELIEQLNDQLLQFVLTNGKSPAQRAR